MRNKNASFQTEKMVGGKHIYFRLLLVLLTSSEGKGRDSSWAGDTHSCTPLYGFGTQYRNTGHVQLLPKESPGYCTSFSVVSAFSSVKMRKIKRKKNPNQHTTHKSKSDNWHDYFRAWLGLKHPGAWVMGETGEAAGWAPQQAGEIKWDLALKHV